MSQRIDLLKNRFEKRLKKFKNKAILINDTIQATTENHNPDDLELRFLKKDMSLEKNKRFNTAQKKIKTSEKKLRSCLTEGKFETELDKIKGCSEKYEDLAIAHLNLAKLCLQQAELAGIKAIATALEVVKRGDLEESTLEE
ncbi:MAG: hypothetical protein AAF717_16970 [Bacteroidota bacterium]